MLTDLVMPGMDGVELIKQVKAIKPDIQPLIASGFADDRIENADINENIYLRKPYSLPVLASKINQIASRGSKS